MGVKAQFISVAVTTEQARSRAIRGVPPLVRTFKTLVWNAGENCEITAYPLNSNGDVPASVNIQGLQNCMLPNPASGLEGNLHAGVQQVVTDSTGKIYARNVWVNEPTPSVDDVQLVLVYAPGTTGDVAPIQVIMGDQTKMAQSEINLNGICVDSGGYIYTNATVDGQFASNKTIVRWRPGTSGNVAPTVIVSSIPDMNTGAGEECGITSLFWDSTNQWIWMSATAHNRPTSGVSTGYVLAYDLSGNQQVRIAGSNTQLGFAVQVCLSPDRHILVAQQLDFAQFPPVLYPGVVFAPGADGNATPVATFETQRGPNLFAFQYFGCAIDANSNAYLSSVGGGRIEQIPLPTSGGIGQIIQCTIVNTSDSLTIMNDDTPTNPGTLFVGPGFS